MLEVKRVRKRFGGLEAVSDVSFTVKKGQIVGLIGPNGAGKTTLFNLISGHLRPDEGRILFQGQDITGTPAAGIAKLGLARTFQIVQPFGNMTVLENVTVGALLRNKRVSQAREKALSVLRQVKLDHRQHRPAASLTTAEKKRLEVARALATDPVMLLLDEVMAGLTPAEVQEALQLIRDARDNGLTILLIEHNLQAVMEISHEVVALNYGKVIARGTPQEVVQNEAVIEAYLGKGDRFA